MGSPAPNQFLAPVSGYEFTDPVTGRTAVGSGWDDLVRIVADRRAANRMPPGDPRAEIYRDYCQKYPARCTGVRLVLVTGPTSTLQHYAATVSGWISGAFAALFQKRAVLVGPTVVTARIEVCRTCKFQRDWRGACKGCSAAVLSLRNKAMKLAGAKQHGLAGCAIYGEDTALSVYLELPPKPDRLAPQHCWRPST